MRKEDVCDAILTWFKGCPTYSRIPTEDNNLDLDDINNNNNNEPVSPSVNENDGLLHNNSHSETDTDGETENDHKHENFHNSTSADLCVELVNHVPRVLRHKRLRMIYSLEKDGASYNTFGNRVCNAGPVIMMIWTSIGQCIGVFIAQSLKKTQSSFVGDSDTFVFHTVQALDNNSNLNNNNNISALGRGKFSVLKVYKTADASNNRCFLHFSGNSLSVGGGGKNFHAIWIGDHLTEGSSYACDTFKSPPLVDSAKIKGFFKIQNVEVFGFENDF
jgi:hypothetical protein